MTTVYPGALDALTNPLGTDQLSSPSHSAQHANANDAIEAIQAELSTDPAGASATVKARLLAIEAVDAALPLGLIEVDIITANQATITTEVAVTGASVVATIAASRYIRVTFTGLVTGTNADNHARVYLKQDGTQIMLGQVSIRTVGAGMLITVTTILTPTAASHTYTATIQMPTGTGSITLSASATQPAQFSVEDLGAV